MATKLGLTSQQKEMQKVDAVAQDLLDRINEVRGRKNMTKSEFADFIGIKRNMYCDWLKNGASSVKFSTLIRAAIRCGIKVEVHHG